MTRKPEAKAYHHLYNSKAWQHLRLAQLRTHYLCRFCEAMGRITPAKVADHVVPHRGDHTMFFEGELQSLCQKNGAATAVHVTLTVIRLTRDILKRVAKPHGGAGFALLLFEIARKNKGGLDAVFVRLGFCGMFGNRSYRRTRRNLV